MSFYTVQACMSRRFNWEIKLIFQMLGPDMRIFILSACWACVKNHSEKAEYKHITIFTKITLKESVNY
jgi:hypothetical protein